MDILNILKQLRDDLKTWVTNNLNALNAKIDEKTIPIDSVLDTESLNPIQNKAVAEKINDLSNEIANKSSFSGDYNDLINAPNIAEDENGDLIIVDENGNVIFKVDDGGIHTTALSVYGQDVSTLIEDKVNKVNGKGLSSNDFTDEFKAKLEELGNIIDDGTGNIHVVDDNGNVILTVDEGGITTTTIHVTEGIEGYATENFVKEQIAALVDSAPDKLNTLDELSEALGNDENFATTVLNKLSEKVVKEEGKGLSANDFTDEYKAQLDNIPNWVKESTKPTLADLEDDSEHRTVTDTEKNVWNNKSDFSGDYKDLENTPNIDDDESGEYVITDEEGNIIFRADSNGVETTQLNAKKIIVDGVDLVELIKSQVRTSVVEEILGGEW